ncbi:serine/threonine protein phosphatase [Lentzea sp. PSKA42]|uniref:Serine/threonine protein phosphatase n=1 Tax=Lentzea indica TaxID=2604800 RepID=A0ABX1FJU7_9PSEU|nr:protein phosphatase 2C domain-containing protein [Lentzea indica]NKE59097.1 serine/threonine protein phosphatase [Lentzea indica]
MTGRGVAWAESEWLLAASVWTEKKPGRGEDAEPLFVHQFSSGEGVVGVFDGAGGAGAAAAGTSASGAERTQAWLASRFTRALVEDWFVGTDRVHEDLHEHIATALVKARGTARRKILGTMRRELPTTMAALHYRWGDDETAEWAALWAGDSRAYVLDAQDGLQQVTRDDTESSDALELLTQDPPMTNMVCADRPFEVHIARGSTKVPCVLVCATDGYFGYVTTPAEFEDVLLRTLERSETMQQWGNALADEVVGYTGDDASLAIVALGFTGFSQLRHDLSGRTAVVREHAAQIAAIAPGDLETLTAVRADSWARYREDYERLMPVKEPR